MKSIENSKEQYFNNGKKNEMNSLLFELMASNKR